MTKKLNLVIKIVLGLFCVLIISPILVVMFSSLLTEKQLYIIYGNMIEVRMGIFKLNQTHNIVFSNLAPDFTVKHYIDLFREEHEILNAYANSIKVTSAIVAGNTILSTITAFVLAKVPFKGSKYIYYMIIVLLIIPVQVTLFPNFIVFKELNILNNIASVIIPGIFNTFGIFILKQYMNYIPDEYISCSRIDGATYIKSMYFIVIPMSKPAILTAIVFSLIESWNMIEQPLVFLQDVDKMPLSLFLFNIKIENIGIGFSASVLFMLPILVVFLLCKKYLIKGIQLSGIK